MNEAGEKDLEVELALMEVQRILREEETRPTARFSPEAQLALTRDRAFQTASTSGHNIEELTQLGHLIHINGLAPKERVITPRSPKTDVAILRGLFLPLSNNRDLSEQMRLLNEFNRTLREKVPNVKAIMGSLAMYADLICGDKINYVQIPKSTGSIRTSTGLEDEGTATIESATIEHGLFISSLQPTTRYSDLYVVPLVVPEHLKID